jgi:hypothetical protein
MTSIDVFEVIGLRFFQAGPLYRVVRDVSPTSMGRGSLDLSRLIFYNGGSYPQSNFLGKTGETMRIKNLTTPWQRSLGAMFYRYLGDTLLLFAYPHPAPRLFHTYFCPSLRIIALGDDGESLFDQVVSPGQFVRLPASCLILEADPDQDLSPALLRELAKNVPKVRAAMGVWDVNASIDRLLFALIKEAVADMRRVHEAHARRGEVQPDVLREKFAPWERGQLTNSASFLQEFAHLCDLPETALHLSWQVLDAEMDYLAEITAASVAGVPWQGDFAIQCLRCANPKASWRPVLDSPPGLAPESAWRYERPENHVPLCRRCAPWLKWGEREDLRLDLAQGLWGQRFAAFWSWHQAALRGVFPDSWDRETHPLWPQTFGGDTWETGSGAFEHADPRPPEGVCQTRSHPDVLNRILSGRGGTKEKRGRGKFTPWRPLMNRKEYSLAEGIG